MIDLQSTSNQANLSRKIWNFLTGLQAAAALIFQANLLRDAFLSFSFTVDTFIWRLKIFLFVLFPRHLLHRSFSFPYKEVEGTSRWFLQLFSFTKSIRNSLDQFHEIYSKVLKRAVHIKTFFLFSKYFVCLLMNDHGCAHVQSCLAIFLNTRKFSLAWWH